MNRRVFRKHQRETGLTHRRSRGENDQVGTLQARRHLVEIGESGRESGQYSRTAFHLLDFLEQLFRDRFDVHEPLPDSFVGELKDRLLRMVENDLGFVFFGECFLSDLV